MSPWARAALLEEQGRLVEARAAWRLAREHARNHAERTQIDARLVKLSNAPAETAS
jgi:predicted RNA polymerase sigma factor